MAWKYGVENSFYVTILTWSFFVLCTPIADAGFLLDFPIRMITKLRMLTSEIMVWIIAIGINIYTFLENPVIYEKTKLLLLFRHILENPFPMWAIILISAIGTFISIHFGDELIDTTKNKKRPFYQKHKNKHQLIILIFLAVIILAFYDFLIKKMGIEF